MDQSRRRQPTATGPDEPDRPSSVAGFDGADPVDAALARLLRVGVSLSAIIVAVGLALMLATTAPTAPGFRGPLNPPVPTAFWSVLTGSARLDPASLIDLGLVVLIATPILRVVAALLAFRRQGDRAFTVISLTVLGLLLAGLLLGQAAG